MEINKPSEPLDLEYSWIFLTSSDCCNDATDIFRLELDIYIINATIRIKLF